MRIKQYRMMCGDFETTVFEGQTYTEVWASAVVDFYSECVKIFNSIGATWEYLKESAKRENIAIYYHNLKFDGTFWLSYIIDVLKLELAADKTGDAIDKVKMQKDREMRNNTFKYSISDRGQWYTIVIKTNGHFIEIRDSLKLLPFSVKAIGKSFKTKHQKLDMEYEGFRYAGCNITDEERAYIANDVLVIKEALEFMFKEGHNKLTIGSCCLDEYKTMVGDIYDSQFPDVYEYDLDFDQYGEPNAGLYIKHSYRGGWCYVVKGKESKIYNEGITCDVNSLYPSVMSGESGNVYPIGVPHFWKGDIPEEAKGSHKYYFVRLRCRFKIKNGYLPFIQIKGSWLYKGTESLTTSDIYNPKTGNYNRYYRDFDGELQDTNVTLTMTMTDFQLFTEHYDVFDLEIMDGCWFAAVKGIFDEYITKYKELKLTSTGAMRTLAKLFLNNLYGKMASNQDSSFKLAYLKDDGSLGYLPVKESDKTPGYIPVGSAITSYARNFTIRAAQKNYYGVNERGFIYADTDSIHCDLKPEELKGIEVDEKDFLKWKVESSWDFGYFVRQKTYIEHVVKEDLKPIDEPYYNVKCAGMPQRCKDLFIASLTGETEKILSEKHTAEEEEFLSKRRKLEDFNVGLKVPSKLMPKSIKGGTLLVNTYYEMRGI